MLTPKKTKPQNPTKNPQNKQSPTKQIKSPKQTNKPKQNHNNLALLKKTTYYLKIEDYLELDKSQNKCLIFRIWKESKKL